MPLRGLSKRVSVAGRMIGPSDMKDQVTFYGLPVRNSDGSNGSPPALFSTCASISALAGEELDKAQQIGQKLSHVIVIPFSDGLAQNGTVQFIDGSGNARTFQIVTAEDPDEQRWQLKVYCFEMGQNAGAI
jgi:Phage head-tail joining protein